MLYIHERTGWPHLTWDMAPLVGLLTDVRYRQGLLSGRLRAQTPSIKRDAASLALTEDLLQSAVLDGRRPDEKRTRASVREKLEKAGSPGYDAGFGEPEAAMLDAALNYADPLSAKRLGRWRAAFSGLAGETVWRGPEDSSGVVTTQHGQIRVHFEPPPFARLEEELEQFLEWYNAGDSLDPVLKAGLAHFRLLCLRPFSGGNGFVARAVCRHALSRAEGSCELYYSLWPRINRERDAYFAVLERCQKGGLDVTAWLRWFMDSLGRALDDAGPLLEPILRGAAIRANAARYPLSARQLQVMTQILDSGSYKLSSGQYAKLAGVSHDTALRDINDLLLNRLVKPTRSGGRSTAYEFVDSAPVG